jgi:hypothetical protein
MPSLADWKPYTHHVQGGLREGNFISSQFAIMCAGPPFLRLLAAGGTEGIGATGAAGGRLPVYPIGLIQSMSLGQSKNISRFFEIGSDRAYFISGRSVGQVSLGRLSYHGPSLLRALYAYYDTSADTTPNSYKMQALFDTSGGASPFGVAPFRPSQANKEATRDVGASLHSIKVPPGYGNYFINLASDLFSQPLGLLFIIKDNEENTYGAFYLEQCYIPQHSMGFDSQGLIISEQVGIQYERLVPIDMSQLKVIRDVDGTSPDGSGFIRDDFGGYPGAGSTL